MTQLKVFEVYKILSTIANVKLGAKKAKDIFLLAKTLEPEHLFFIKARDEIIANSGGQATPEGQIKFETKEAAEQCRNDLSELEAMEVDIELPKITLSDADLEKLELSIRDIALLDGVVYFE